MEHSNLWAMFFASLSSMSRHPGFQKADTRILTLEDCASYADLMLQLYRQRFDSSEQH